MQKSRVLVTVTEDYPVDIQTVNEVLSEIADIHTVALPHRALTAEEESDLIEEMKDVIALFVRPGIITERTINAAKKLRIIAVHGAGVDQIDVKAATKKGIFVTNVPGGNAEAVAELTMGLMLSLVRRIPFAVKQVREKGQWGEARFLGTELRGKTLGIIGLGHVGTAVAKIARGFDMKILYYKRKRKPELEKILDIEYKDLNTLLQESDFISIHVPLTDETYHMLSEQQFKLMRKTAFLVNTSRGKVVDEAALYKALKENRIAGAALDVLEKEPPTSSNPLLQQHNVVITPHMAGSTRECLQTIAKTAAEDIAAVLRGELPKNLVNVEALRMKQASLGR